MDKQSSRFMECIGYLLKKGIVKSNRDVAAALGVSPSTITDIGKGRNPVSPVYLRKFSELYGFSFEYLSGETDSLVTDVQTTYAVKDRVITLPQEAYDALIYKINDLERRLKEECVKE